jgi:hypothetical protein
MTWVTELVACVLIAGALVLLGLGKVSFEQALSIITLGVGLITGKYMAEVDRYLEKKYANVGIVRKFKREVTAISFEGDTVAIYVLPEFYREEIVSKIVNYAGKLFPARKIEVRRGERIKLV